MELVEIEKRIAQYIKKLPDDSVVSLVKTSGQIEYLMSCQQSNKWVSDCWIARITLKDDPLQELVDTGKMLEATHRSIYYLVHFFQSLWGVIQIGWKHIKKELGRGCPFRSAAELFEAILRVWFNNDFATCLQHHWGLTVSDLNKSFKLAKAYTNGLIHQTKIEQQAISELRSISTVSSQFNNIWLLLSLSICHENSGKDSLLSDELDAFYQRILQFCNFGEEWSSRKRPSKKYPKLRSLQIIEGEVYV